MKCKGEIWFLVFNNDFSVCVCDDQKVLCRLFEILIIKLVQQEDEITNTDLDCSHVLTADTFGQLTYNFWMLLCLELQSKPKPKP